MNNPRGPAAHRIDLLYFEGCPNAGRARDSLRQAIGEISDSITWTEWDLADDATPAEFRRHGSPTILVNGKDVTGGGAGAVALACRADGAPDVATILRALL